MSAPRGRLLVFAGAVLAAAVGTVALATVGDGDEDAPVALLDGTPAPPAPEVLGLGSAGVLARAHLLPARARDPTVRSCLRLAGVAQAPPRIVEVIGLHGRSLAFAVPGEPALAACEASARRAEPRAGPWCGVAQGRLVAGRLRDGRLGMVNCRDRDGGTVAFGWIEPRAGARWLAVRQSRTVEVYPVVRGFPLRVTSRDVDTSTSSALFAVTHYASDGRKLAEDTVEMRAAG